VGKIAKAMQVGIVKCVEKGHLNAMGVDQGKSKRDL